MARRYDARDVATQHLSGALLDAAIIGAPVHRLYPGLVPGRRRWHCTIRKPREEGEPLPALVRVVIQYWTNGQSARWIARRFSIDQATVRRWVTKHSWAVREEIRRAGCYGALNEFELRRRKKTLMAMGAFL